MILLDSQKKMQKKLKIDEEVLDLMRRLEKKFEKSMMIGGGFRRFNFI